MRINEDYIDSVEIDDLPHEQPVEDIPDVSDKCIGQTDNKTMQLDIYIVCSVFPDYTKSQEQISLDATNVLKRVTRFLEKS